MMDSNLNLVKPFSILITRHWSGWDALNGLNQSKATQSWCEKWNTAQANFNPIHDPKHVVVTVLQPTTQSQPSPTIHYTNNDRLEGFRCCEIPKSIQTSYSILVWNIGAFYLLSTVILATTHDSEAGVWWWSWMLDSNLNLAQPFIVNNETLEWLRCSEFPEWVQSHSILVRKL